MGKAMLALVLLLAAAGGGGYYNYQRNAHLDEELGARPYASLSTEQLELLVAAYQQERDELARQVAVVAADDGSPSRAPAADFMGKVSDFDRAQRDSVRWREVRGQMLEREVELEKLEREKGIRARGLDDEWTRIWRRVTTL
jgi:hypothetical protein